MKFQSREISMIFRDEIRSILKTTGVEIPIKTVSIGGDECTGRMVKISRLCSCMK